MSMDERGVFAKNRAVLEQGESLKHFRLGLRIAAVPKSLAESRPTRKASDQSRKLYGFSPQFHFSSLRAAQLPILWQLSKSRDIRHRSLRLFDVMVRKVQRIVL